MKRTKLARVGAAAVGAVTAATTFLFGGPVAVADEQRPDQAYVLAAQGVLNIPPTPYVKSVDGKLVEDQLIGIGPINTPFDSHIKADVLKVRAEDNLASAAVTELNVLEILKADAIDTWCVNGKGGLEIIGGSVLGQPLPPTPVSNFKLDLSPVAKLTLNEQTWNDDGTLTVTGIRLELLNGVNQLLKDLLGPALPDLLPNADAAQTLTIGSATCGTAGDGDGGNGGNGGSGGGDEGSGSGSGGGSGSGSGDGSGGSGSGSGLAASADGSGGPALASGPEAPKPEIVAADLAVTG